MLSHQGVTLLVFFLTFALNIYLFFIVPKGFFPLQDTGRLSGRLQLQQDTSFITLRDRLQQVANQVMKDRAVQNVLGFAGGGGPGGGSFNTASFFVILKDSDQRLKVGDTADKIIGRLRPLTANMPGTLFTLQSSQELNIGGRQGGAAYQYTLSAQTVEDLDTWAPKLEDAMKHLPELKGHQHRPAGQRPREQPHHRPRYGVAPRRLRARHRLRALRRLRAAPGVHHLPRAQPVSRRDGSGSAVPAVARGHSHALREVVQRHAGSAIAGHQAHHGGVFPLSVNHQGLSPAATLSFNLSDNTSLSQATDAIEAARIKIGMPSTIVGGFQGSAQAFQASLSSEPILLGLAIFTVYIILGILYESFIHPITILSTLPSAGVGAFLALLLFKIDLSIIAIIGIILLIGIVKKNAIMMIDFALVAEREHGKSPRDAIFEACMLRFRPIMMTTMAAILGAVPMAFGTGTGSELRKPLGVTIIGGLVVSQCLTLFTTPVIYLFFDVTVPKIWRWFLRLIGWNARTPQGQPEHAAAD